MAIEKPKGDPHEPRGLGEHNRAPTSEWAHEQGWGLNEEERQKQPEGRPEYYGGKGYDYGSAQDFGDSALKIESDEEANAETKRGAA